MTAVVELLERWMAAYDRHTETGDPWNWDDILAADTRRTLDHYAQLEAQLAAHPSSDAPARLFDPDQSHTVSRSIAADVTLRAQILDVAAQFERCDVQDITDAIHRRYGTNPQRGWISRAVGLMAKEAEPPVRFVARVGRDDRKVPTNHYQHWSRTP